MSSGSLPQEPSDDPGELSGGFFQELFPAEPSFAEILDRTDTQW